MDGGVREEPRVLTKIATRAECVLRSMSGGGISSNSTAVLSTPLVGLALILGVLVIVLCSTMRARRRAEDAAYKRWRSEMESSMIVAVASVQAPEPLPRSDVEIDLLRVPELNTYDATPEVAHTPCNICLEPLHTSVVVAGRCGHVLHASCMRAWLARDVAQSCPVCREHFV